MIARVSLWLFASFEIRHLWQGKLSLLGTASNGALYTDSSVWLLLAMTALLTGNR